MASSNPSISVLLSKPAAEIASFLASIYEHSAWVADELTSAPDRYASIESATRLAAAMKSIVDAAPREKKLELLCAHPDLCEKVGALENLTAESQAEQSRSGLQALTDEELERFTKYNIEYRKRFGFPFILAVRNASKFTVLAALRGRVTNAVEIEFVTALQQVHKIAWMRLLAKLDTSNTKGFLTCHVLDTANGCPGTEHLFDLYLSGVCCADCFILIIHVSSIAFLLAAGMRIHLYRLSDASPTLIKEFVTNEDGRLESGPALVGGAEFTVGLYEFLFYTAEYFASKGTFTSGTPFLDAIPIRFGIDNPDDHYHVPLLVSPWSFSTYRGS